MVPLDALEMPRKPLPESTTLLPSMSEVGADNCGRQAVWKPSPASTRRPLARNPAAFEPPPMKTRPSGSSVAVWYCRGVSSVPAGSQLPVAGSYNSMLASGPLASVPPTVTTFPLGSKVVLWAIRAVVREPVMDQLPVAGS